jgi:hypothetical protein
MQAPFHVYYYHCFPKPPPPPTEPVRGLGAVQSTLTQNGLPGLFPGARGPQEPPSELPVNLVVSTARSWLAGCKEPQQVAAGLQHYAPLLRVQGWTLLIADCGKRGGAHSCGCPSASRPTPDLYLSHPIIDRHPNSACHVWLHP